MLTSRLPAPKIYNAPSTLTSQSAPSQMACTLRWRQGKLWVSKMGSDCDIALPALASEEWLEACLTRSQVQAVCIELGLNSAAIRLWARACGAAQKPLFLRLPSLPELPKKQYPLAWRIKRLLDFATAALLLAVLSPLMLILSVLVTTEDGGPVFYSQWRVGERGRLFRIYKFRSMVPHAESLHTQVMGNQTGLHKLENDPRITTVGYWIRKFSLDELPQLVNVLRGDMSLVGPRPWAIYDAVRVAPELHQRLQALPGMTGAWQVYHRSNELNLNTVNKYDLQYLTTWSLLEDFKLLALTLPKAIRGVGAC